MDRCKNANLAYQFECGTGFQYIGNLEVKCTIQMVLEALAGFDSFDDLQVYVEGLVDNQDLRDFPEIVCSRIEKLSCILYLQKKIITEDWCSFVDKLYRYLMTINRVKRIVKGVGRTRFLKH